MELEKLQLVLRPRPPRQALELGYTLLRLAFPRVYQLMFLIWTPLALLLTALSVWRPENLLWYMLLGWLLQPLFERAILYLLAHQVFGEALSVRQVVRAWPRQLAGGIIGMLFWRRANRGLFHAVWQLENQRGRQARQRKQVLGQAGTTSAAYWFGFMCQITVVLIQIGIVCLAGMLFSDQSLVNPFLLLSHFVKKPESLSTILSASLTFYLALGLIMPVYTAGCFTLYLNRRATLEAWDLELSIRQIRPPAVFMPQAGKLGLLAACVLALHLLWPQPVQASVPDVENADKCEAQRAADIKRKRSAPKDEEDKRILSVESAADAEQRRIRQETRAILRGPEFSTVSCQPGWRWRWDEKPVEKKSGKPKNDNEVMAFKAMLEAMGMFVKVLLIAALFGAVVWLLWRYREQLANVLQKKLPERATEVGGLDIRPDSLPADVPASAWDLWQRGEQRAALALLYRATLSRLVEQNNLQIAKGATEGDCLRNAERASALGRLPASRLERARRSTTLWRDAAWGNLWPDSATVQAECNAWRNEFMAPAAGGKA